MAACMTASNSRIVWASTVDGGTHSFHVWAVADEQADVVAFQGLPKAFLKIVSQFE